MISVIMSTYKEDVQVLKQAIESILNQTYRDFEFVIILDNPENQEHVDCIKYYQKKDSSIKFYINEQNVGLVKSLNRAISLCSGEYIARMDADDISLPTRLEHQLNYLQENNYDMVGGITQMMDERGQLIFSIQKVPTDFEKIKKALCFGQCLAHPTWLVKKEVYKTLQGYREIALCEDYDFTLRAVLSGYRVSNLNETVLKYRMTLNSLSRTNLYEQYLYMVYISNEYKHGRIAVIDNACNYVKKNNKASVSKRYRNANMLFNEVLSNKTNHDWFLFIRNGIEMVFSSLAYLNKIYRFFRLSLYS